MVTGSQIMRNRISAAGTARLDRGFTSQNRDDWLRQVAGKIRLAINRRIPVGFEDETGFHLGVQSARENDRVAGEREGFFADDEHF
jgi:hypothetical protein